MEITTATRFHDFSAGHRVHGHESKCSNLHGHNYRVTFTCQAHKLDSVGRVIDFSVIKTELCDWLEDNWDHNFLLWEKDDSVIAQLLNCSHGFFGVIRVPFNPTAENMASHLLQVGNRLLNPKGIQVVKVVVEETRKCSAAAERCA
jgi:6-pyruvoyltetrahydropterin/6-carboxytetrahydropterin synthase